MRGVRWMVLGLALWAAGCTAGRPVATPGEAPATRPTDPALFTLEQIEPAPVLPKAAPSTAPAKPPPLDAIQVYAQARAAQVGGDRARAIVLLERALALDPDSFDLNFALGQAYLGNASTSDAAIRALEKAARIDPDHLDVHVLLGRQYLARGDAAKAIDELRLAMQTTEYKSRPDGAALVSLHLAKALQQKGYDLAALEQYERLADLLKRRMSMRGTPELYYLVNRPDLIHVQMGQLNEKHGRYEKALECYRLAAERDPESFAYQSHVVHALLGLKRVKEARKLAAELVSTHQASADSVSLLREVYRVTGQEQAAVGALRELLKKRPADVALTFALADVLRSLGNQAEAESLLVELLRQTPGDLRVASRLFEYYYDRGGTESAARVVVETLARQPDAIQQMQRMWSRLISPVAKRRLRLPMMQGMQVADWAEAARLYLTARVAELWGREALARSSLERAVGLTPAFAPAYRDLLLEQLQREDWSEQQKQKAAAELIERAATAGQAGLAAELRGMLLDHQKKPAEAAEAFHDAIRRGNRSASAQFALASTMLASGRQADAESLLWRIVQDHPSFDGAYMTLFRHYLEKGQGQQALKVLQTWLGADPLSVNARLLQISVFAQSGNEELAESALSRLFAEQSDNPAVLGEMSRFYMRGGRIPALIDKLEEQRARQPDNRLVVDALVSLYDQQKRPEDAVRVVDAMRAAAADDPEQLYFVAHLYERVGRRALTEQVLEQALAIDPRSGPANNDLGYMWADDGKHLARAEAMIRIAVEVEPDNAAYLDSLGWVLYKRGRFAEAHRCLDDAAKASGRPDPVVLDHLGDALYRLKRAEEAARVWQRSLDRLEQMKSEREDLKKLRAQLGRKLEQHRAGGPVDVASAETASDEAREPGK